MKNFTSPLDSIKIASPCSANWDEMYGDDRKRFCSECKLNVYNLSGMTPDEAENFLINSEGRVCVKFYRRRDGSVLTKDCPVGWQAVKKRVSQTASALFSMYVGISGGIFVFNQTLFSDSDLVEKVSVEADSPKENFLTPVAGEPENLDEIKFEINKKYNASQEKQAKKNNYQMVMGRVVDVRPAKDKPEMKDKPIALWVE